MEMWSLYLKTINRTQKSPFIAFLLLTLSVAAMAQQAEQEQIPMPLPTAPEEEVRSLGGQTFTDDVFQSKHNTWGFSLSGYQAYTTDMAIGNQPRAGSAIIFSC